MKRSRAQNTFQVFLVLLMFGLMLLWLIPFANVIAISLSMPLAVVRGEVGLWPIGFFAENYKKILSMNEFYLGYRNTLMYTILGTSLSLFLTVLYAYPISKPKLRGRKFFMAIILFSMLFSPGMIPTYLAIRSFGLINSLWAVILPFCVSTWNIVVMRTFFANIPEEIEEAALIDGMNPIQILGSIVLPLSRAVISTIGLFYAVGYWNSWFWQMILIDNAKLHPVSLFLRRVIKGAGYTGDESGAFIDIEQAINSEGLRAASILLVVLPIIMVYPFIQKYFEKGVVVGSLKG